MWGRKCVKERKREERRAVYERQNYLQMKLSYRDVANKLIDWSNWLLVPRRAAATISDINHII